MFLEPYFKGQRSGWIEVICGSMFSGKTEELIRRLKRAQIAEQQVIVFKPLIDSRYDDKKVVSHDAREIHSIPIDHSEEILAQSEEFDVVGIDESQFFDMDLTETCEELALGGKRVIVAGLDLDYKGKPFGPMPHLMAAAEYVTKVHAICVHCGSLATHSYRIVEEDQTVLIGEKETYEARCRRCFKMGNILKLPKKQRGKSGESDPELFSD
jgi:thymidine kinase